MIDSLQNLHLNAAVAPADWFVVETGAAGRTSSRVLALLGVQEIAPSGGTQVRLVALLPPRDGAPARLVSGDSVGFLGLYHADELAAVLAVGVAVPAAAPAPAATPAPAVAAGPWARFKAFIGRRDAEDELGDGEL